MKVKIKVGVSVIFIYIILILFTIYMINRVERLNVYVYYDINSRISIGV